MDITMRGALTQGAQEATILTFTVWPTDSDELSQIILQHLPQWAELFAAKNSEYGDNAKELGQRGQFADIWRKIGKLKTGIWDDNEAQLTTESVDEILLDLIGHCFLTLRLRAQLMRDYEEESALQQASEESLAKLREALSSPIPDVTKMPSTWPARPDTPNGERVIWGRKGPSVEVEVGDDEGGRLIVSPEVYDQMKKEATAKSDYEIRQKRLSAINVLYNQHISNCSMDRDHSGLCEPEKNDSEPEPEDG